jgi:23S rRNA (adenine2030-N6)-methyltransferase
MLIDHPNDRERLNGSGLFVLNPPWMLREEADVVLPALAGRLSRSGYGAFRCERFGPEA